MKNYLIGAVFVIAGMVLFKYSVINEQSDPSNVLTPQPSAEIATTDSSDLSVPDGGAIEARGADDLLAKESAVGSATAIASANKGGAFSEALYYNDAGELSGVFGSKVEQSLDEVGFVDDVHNLVPTTETAVNLDTGFKRAFSEGQHTSLNAASCGDVYCLVELSTHHYSDIDAVEKELQEMFSSATTDPGVVVYGYFGERGQEVVRLYYNHQTEALVQGG